jgi:hypothetical protein
MDVIGHLDQFQDSHLMFGSDNTKSGKEDQMVADGIEQNAFFFRALVTVINDSVVTLSCFHEKRVEKILSFNSSFFPKVGRLI